MTLGDLASIVQLSVAFHAGTALLQTSTEFFVQPVERRARNLGNVLRQRLKRSAPNRRSEIEDQLDRVNVIIGQLNIRKVTMEKHYRICALINAIASFAFLIGLFLISAMSRLEIDLLQAFAVKVIVFAPVVSTMAHLFDVAEKLTRGPVEQLSSLEGDVYRFASRKSRPPLDF